MNKSDVRTLKRGLRRVLVALITAGIFSIATLGFIAVAFMQGYLAVLVFLVSLAVLGFAIVLLYAQGINPKIHKESKGEKNEWNIPL